MFNTLYFVSLPIGQSKLKNNLPEVISACFRQTLISNPKLYQKDAALPDLFLFWKDDFVLW